MKRLLLLSIPALCTLLAAAQPNPKTAATPKMPPPKMPPTKTGGTGAATTMAQHENVYSLAMQTGDYMTAASALHYLIVQNPGYTWRDTLATVYYMGGMYPQSVIWADESLRLKPGNQDMMYVKAMGLSSSRQPVEALKIFEELSGKNPQNANYLYQVANLQFGLKRQYECLASCDKLLGMNIDSSFKLPYSMGDNQQGGLTYIKSYVNNMKGMTFYELKDKTKALEAFSKAVQIDKENRLAAQNMMALQQEIESDKMPKMDKVKEEKTEPVIMKGTDKKG